MQAQISTGVVEGAVRSSAGKPQAGLAIEITGALGFRVIVLTNDAGEFAVTLPHGRYQLSAGPAAPRRTIFAAALATTRIDLVVDSRAGVWMDATGGLIYPEPFSAPAVILSREPSSVTQPLNFTGAGDRLLALQSQRAFSWTYTQFKLEGMDATDSYQPGRPVILPDVEALEEISVRGGFAQTASSSYGSEIGNFLAAPGMSWHGALVSVNTGSPFAASNLPSPPDRGQVTQSNYFKWFSRDTAEIGGPLTKRADVFAVATGEWSRQTMPLAAIDDDQRSRLLFANVRGRYRAGAKDQFDVLYSGSRIDLNNFGMPAAIESLVARRDSPSFILPEGFSGQSEVDHFDFLQAGWSRQTRTASGIGAIEIRYGFATAHMDTNRSAAAETRPQSRIELLDGAVTGAPPMENLAARTRHQIEGVWQPGLLHHQIAMGAGWKTQTPLNRITAPSDMNLVTAGGAPGFALELNTPLDSKSRIRTFTPFVADHWAPTPAFSIDVAALADLSRGSLPTQSSGGGIFAAPRSFSDRQDLIVWNSISPRAGFAWRIPHTSRVVIRGTYLRAYAPLAGHSLDFSNPNSLGGAEYRWMDRNADGIFQPAELGPLVMRFGGPYSSISSNLQRPYSDEFDLGAELGIARRTVASFHLFRRDEKDRLAAVDVGVPPSAFTAVRVTDPNAGTLTAYSQNPSTFGQDRYVLTNPAGLRMLYSGLIADVRTGWHAFHFEASFAAEKSFGPTNPGDAAIENDPGVIGALYMDPNTSINAAGRTFFDRGYLGKLRATYRLPWRIDVMSVADYLDGLVFARQVLVEGLAQGPVVIAATVRGSPEGGNRAQYVLNWNLRAQREFRLRSERLTAAVDVLNVANSAQRIQESDVSGPLFLDRLPVAIQEPRVFRFLIRYDF